MCTLNTSCCGNLMCFLNVGKGQRKFGSPVSFHSHLELSRRVCRPATSAAVNEEQG